MHEKEVVDAYISILRKYFDYNHEEKSEAVIKVNQSFSVIVGKAITHHECASHMGLIYHILNTRYVRNTYAVS